MALPASGQISLNDIQTELGGSNPISISEYYSVGGLPASGQISFSDFYGVTLDTTDWQYSDTTHQYYFEFDDTDAYEVVTFYWNGTIIETADFDPWPKDSLLRTYWEEGGYRYTQGTERYTSGALHRYDVGRTLTGVEAGPNQA